MRKTKKDGKLYSDAVKYALSRERLSLSMLQRNFQIGFNDALALYDRLVNDGRITKNSGIMIFPKQDLG